MAETMKCAMVTGPRRVEIADMTKPSAGRGQVLLKVCAVGICGSDLKYFAGHLQPGTGYPLLLGHEFTGEIVEVGSGVEGYEVGMKVACAPDRPCGECEWCLKGETNVCPNVKFAASDGVPGCLSEYYVATVPQLYPIPAGLDVVDAVLFEPFAIALHMVENVIKPSGGETWAIIGSGTIGLTMLLAAKMHGASRVYASDYAQDRIDLAAKLGADAVCNASKADFGDLVVRETDGRGVDIVVEAGGTQESIWQSFSLASIHGIVVIEGIPHEEPVTVDITAARKRELTILVGRRSRHKDDRALELLADGTVDSRLFTAARFPLERAQEAFDAAKDRTGGTIKAVITP